MSNFKPSRGPHFITPEAVDKFLTDHAEDYKTLLLRDLQDQVKRLEHVNDVLIEELKSRDATYDNMFCPRTQCQNAGRQVALDERARIADQLDHWASDESIAPEDWNELVARVRNGQL